ncbi:PDGLE domain-containing protein [Actinoplanes aureus]|uniref:PDGLE domain-containing protein n=1 Tax=Actinoplanes aureus TaxID=2792083 RepID=A0A931CCN4_9ACTN|nr:PDGLE domain-containing protein [Actinoplanes aureus]MBG0562465.1 PDGLE domain-containing protein [Actinoplanes aureus]
MNRDDDRDAGLDILDGVGAADRDSVRRRRRLGWFLVAGLLVALVLAGVVSNFASESPDGLDHAARVGCVFDVGGEIIAGTCMAQGETGHELAGSPFADYAFGATGLSGVIGVLATFVLGSGLIRLTLVAKS